MMSKILITSLGKGSARSKDYETIPYYFEDFDRTIETKYFFDALIEIYDIDKLIILGTAESNWADIYPYYSVKLDRYNEEDFDLIVNSPVENINIIEDLLSHELGHEDSVYCRIIQFGKNQAEIDQNFEDIMAINSLIQPNDELILDITHSFRSIPMFLMALTDFISTIRQEDEVKLTGLYYGMLNNDKGLAVKLSSIYELNQWSKATYNFIHYGNGYDLADLVEDEQVSKYFTEITEYFMTNQLQELKASLTSCYNYISNENFSGPIQHVIPIIQAFLKRMQQKDLPSLQLELAKWTLENRQYNNFFLYVTQAVLSQINQLSPNDQKAGTFNADKKAKEYIQLLGDKEFVELFDEAYNFRNRIAHPGSNKNKNLPKNGHYYINKAPKYIKCFEKNVFNNGSKFRERLKKLQKNL